MTPGTKGIILAGLLLASPAAFALNPALDISQYAHTSWKTRDGFVKGLITAIAQTPDGYLWLATEFGLVRFDGIRAVPWSPPPDQPLPSGTISRLLVARDGTLWIGTSKGLASWKGGKLTQYPDLAGHMVLALIQMRDDSVWAGTYAVPSGKLCAIRNGDVQCDADSALHPAVSGLYEDRAGNFWVGVRNGLWRWTPGPPRLYPIPAELNGIQGLTEDQDGTLLIGTRSGIRRLIGDKTEPLYPFPDAGHFDVTKLLRDRDGGLWAGTSNHGLIHFHQGRTDAFRASDGLSADYVGGIFEDREGNVWVATLGGLDRFRDFPVPTLSVDQGLSNATVTSVVAAHDGTFWLGTFDGLNHWDKGQITVYREHSAHTKAGVREIVGSGLPQGVQSIYGDGDGRIWVSTRRGMGYLEDNRLIPISAVPGGNTSAIAKDTAGSLWILNLDSGLMRLSARQELAQIPWAHLGHKDNAMSLAADPKNGGIWLGFYRGGVVYFKDGQVRESYSTGDGLGAGYVCRLHFDREGVLWAATAGGLSRLRDGRFITLNSSNGFPCDAVHWVMEDDAQSTWLSTACGLVRISRTELDAWAADPRHAVNLTVFDTSDGVSIRALPFGYTPQVAKSHDGTLWFVTGDGVGMIDPRHLAYNRIPPPVEIEQITANRKTYNADAGLPLPPLIRDLQIDYTALSLVAPEKVKFRYKLEGHDNDWQDAGTRRQAFYNDLPPRSYRFRVMACNNSGVWNEAGAAFDFSIAPAYYQTTWFLMASIAAALACLAALYQLRLRYVQQQFNLRLEERVNERTRIARDLHDTLLQSFQGVLMKFSVVPFQIPDRPEVQKTLEAIVAQARQAIAEGREAVQGLRASTVVTNDLARAIDTAAQELATAHTAPDCPEFRLEVQGVTRDLPPLVRDEVHRIACEALRNAFRHAQARQIEVEIWYAERQFRLVVRDNGKGIDPEVLAAGERTGHHGLPGMRERASLVKGKLNVQSQPASGTELELTIPAAFAYQKPSATRG